MAQRIFRTAFAKVRSILTCEVLLQVIAVSSVRAWGPETDIVPRTEAEEVRRSALHHRREQWQDRPNGRRTCLVSMILAGRTRSTVAPKHLKAFTFSSATSSGMMIATRARSFRELDHSGIKSHALASYPLKDS